MTEQNLKLESKIVEVTSTLRANQWYEVTRLHFPNHPNNPYARIGYGEIHPNGLHESAIGYFTIYWDGTVLRRGTL